MKKYVLLGLIGLALVGCGSSGTSGTYTPISVATPTDEPQEADTLIVNGNSGAFTYVSNGDGTVVLSGDITIENAEDLSAAACEAGGVAPNEDGTCPDGYELASCGHCFPIK